MLPIKYLLTLENELSPHFKRDPLTALGIGSAIVGGLSSFFSSKSANNTNVLLAREAQDWQSAESEKARQWQEKMWNMQNEYNTPANQRRLAEEAGYNPYLLGSQNLGSGAGSAGSPAMSSAPPTAHVNPVDPVRSATDTVSQILPLIQQGQQIESNVELQHSKTIQTLADLVINTYDKFGPKGYKELMPILDPVLSQLNFEGSRSDEIYQNILQNWRSQRYNQDMDSLNKEFMYETSKKWTDKEKQNLFDNLKADTEQKYSQIVLNGIEGNLKQGELKRIASEIARNFADAFSAQKQGEYYEISGAQMSLMTKMLDLQYQEAEADFAFGTAVRKFKKEIPNRGIKLGLFLGDIQRQNVGQSIEGNETLQYLKQVSSMVGDVFKVNFGASVNRTNFNNLNPDKPGKMFYSGDGYYLNNGILNKGNW